MKQQTFDPEFAVGRGIRRTMPHFFFRKKFVRCPCIALTFSVKKVSASLVSVLTPIAKSGFNGITALCVGVMFIVNSAAADSALDIEGGYVVPGYIDVAIPGDTGTRFSLTDDLDADEAAAWRVRYSHMLAKKHWLAVLAAPLTITSHGTLEKDVDFNGTTFANGTTVDGTFRFDSYRLIYRYLISASKEWLFGIGGALKVRDAAIKLSGGGLESEKRNTGGVPLLSFTVTWTPVQNIHLLADGEALAAPQGRAEDILIAGQYDISERISLKAGYRMLEGGSDTDEVYTFSLFHYIIAGMAVSF